MSEPKPNENVNDTEQPDELQEADLENVAGAGTPILKDCDYSSCGNTCNPTD